MDERPRDVTEESDDPLKEERSPSPSVRAYDILLASLVKRWRLILPFVLLLFLTFIPLPVDTGIQHALAVFVCVAALWVLGGLPLAVTALLVPVLMVLYGLVPTAASALAPFAQPVNFLMLGGLIIAQAFHKTGLDRRLAYKMVSLSKGDMRKTLLSLMLVSAGLSMWISNTATVALLIPVVLGICSKAGEERSRMCVVFLLSVAFASALGGMATITGSPPNAIASGLLQQEIRWTFFDWMKIGVPISVVLLIFTWWVFPRIFPFKRSSLDISGVEAELRQMGPLTSLEKRTLTIFFPTVFLWIAGPQIAPMLGIPGAFMNSAIIALLGCSLLFASGALAWRDAKDVSWDIFLIIGGGLALGEGLAQSGAAVWIADGVVAFAGDLGVLAFVFLIVAVTVLLTNFISNTATAAVFVPILIGVSAVMALDVKILVLACALAASLAFVTPIGTPPVTLIFSTDLISRRELAKGGLLLTIPCMVAVTIFCYLMVIWGLL